jgi:hypothetical protein
MTKIVISQPMFFPWVGLFEQITLADTYVHYNTVQFPIGRSLMNRVQIKTSKGSQWLTIPIKHQGIQSINQVEIDYNQHWQDKHLKTLRQNYSKSQFFMEMLDIVSSIYAKNFRCLSELNIYSIEHISKYFGIETQFITSSQYSFDSSSSELLLNITESLNGDTYITGHGAKNYLEHSIFEKKGISVEYINYKKISYPQLYGEFTPFVSVLDLIANLGKEGKAVMLSKTINWQEFVK